MSQRQSETSALPDRWLLSAIGAGAGLALWFLAEVLPDLTDNDRLFVALVMLVGGFFAVLLAATGPLPLRRAAGVALLVSAVSQALFSWAGLRFDAIESLFDTGHAVAAYVVLVAIPVPFLIAALRPGESWQDYPALFTHAWEITVRYATAWGFTAIFWGVVFLSDAVLKVVGIDAIERLIDLEAVPYLLTGTMLGLGLAVVHELRHLISPVLLLRLLRLLLPLVFAVSLVFVIAAPINGLSGLFGAFSAAATLMGMAVAAVTLVTVALDRDDASAAAAPVLAWSARLMSLLVPVLGGLALWAVVLRIGQYGHTPARLAAATAALITLAYGLSYGWAVVRGAGWQARIRRANTGLALGLVALAALWLSPLLNVETLSVRSQIARFEAGAIGPGELDLWALGREWGRAGTAALQPLRSPDHPQAAALAEAFAKLDDSNTRWQFESENRSRNARVNYDALVAQLPVRPAGKSLPADLFDTAAKSAPGTISSVLAGCERQTPAGAPGCVAVMGNFLPPEGDEIILVYWTGSRIKTAAIDEEIWQYSPPGLPGADLTDPALIDRLQSGDFALVPMQIEAIQLDDLAIGLRP